MNQHVSLTKITKVDLESGLPHASVCADPKCAMKSCPPLKEILQHGSKCTFQGCTECQLLEKIVILHVDTCKIHDCPVILCNKIKQQKMTTAEAVLNDDESEGKKIATRQRTKSSFARLTELTRSTSWKNNAICKKSQMNEEKDEENKLNKSPIPSRLRSRSSYSRESRSSGGATRDELDSISAELKQIHMTQQAQATSNPLFGS